MRGIRRKECGDDVEWSIRRNDGSDLTKIEHVQANVKQVFDSCKLSIEPLTLLMRMTLLFLFPLSALLLIVGSACDSDDPQRVVVTRWTAEIEGILTEENGCLRVTSDHDREPQGQALVWQKSLFNIERRGDNVLIVDLFGPNRQPAPTVIWRLGDMIRGGGGVIGPAGADDHTGAGFSERCVSPYFLVSMVE